MCKNETQEIQNLPLHNRTMKGCSCTEQCQMNIPNRLNSEIDHLQRQIKEDYNT